MKRLLCLVLGLGVYGSTVFAVSDTSSDIYVANKSSVDVVFSSATVPFRIQEMQFSVAGTYAVITSSFSNGADSVYVNAGVPFTWKPAEPILMKNQATKIKLSVQSGSTVYYYIGGTR